MGKERIPKLTASHVRKLATEKSFERGLSYYRGGAITEPVRQGMELRADCEGSEYEPYQIRVTLDANGVREAECDCPYEYGGICKHIVALLLTYAHKPQAFRVIPPLENMLAPRSKEELIAIIGEMVRREPELMSVLELAAAKQSKQGEPMDGSAYARHARRAMRHDSSRAIEKELKALRDEAARLAKTGDHLNAGVVYHAVLREAVGSYHDLVHSMDEDGDIAIVVDELAEGLSNCLKKSNADKQTRRAWLKALLEAELADIELGGIDLAPSARDAVLEQADDEEWDWIEERVRAPLSKSRDWARQSLVEFLTEGQQQRGRDSEAAALVREMGTPEQRVFLLIGEGRVDEAMRRVREIIPDKPGLVTQFADALVEAGAKREAVELAAKHAGWQRAQWLASYYRKHGSPQEALEWQQRLFLDSPSVEAFKALRAMSKKTGNWEQVRVGALAQLEREKKIGALIEIALDENDVARALELLPGVERGSWRDYRGEVAKAAEKALPQHAIALYKEMAQRAINERNRSAYQRAAEHLKRIKKLCERLNAQSDWNAYIQSLRAQYTNLPALQDELQKARL